MARQLLQDRTPAAYAGVEGYARRHAQEDAGALAWLVVGYAHVVDHDYAKAIDPLNRAKARAGDLGEYVTYYLGTSYMQTGRTSEAISTLAGFETKYPDSLLIRDAHVIYANALMQDGRPQAAVALLERDREPARVDVEWNLGRAYEAAGNSAKAATVFRNIYLSMPLAGEADTAAAELKKLSGSTTVAPMTVEERKSRADLLAKGRRYGDAAGEYHDLLNDVSPAMRSDVAMAMAGAQMRSGHAKDAKHLLESLQGLNDDQSAQKL
jgi:soluble lytic murein transglycosylase